MVGSVPQTGIVEDRAREQCFFAPETVALWAMVASSFERPCLLCAPTVGAALPARVAARVLDVDERFGHVPGFQRWDIARARFLPEKFGVILCDPPFFGVSLRELAGAIGVLAHFDRTQPVAVAYLKRRERALLRVLSRFGVAPTGSKPAYAGVIDSGPGGRNEVEVYANFAWPVVGVGARSVQRSPR